MPTRTVDRIVFETTVAERGSGGPMLLIHGLGGTSNTWSALMPALTSFNTVRIDLPGSGRSHRVEGALSIDRFVDSAFKVMTTAGVERFHVLGHSTGAIVATHMAVREPGKVRSLALFGPLLAPPDAARVAIRERGAKARSESIAGMQTIADALVQSATSSQTRRERPIAMAFVRESLMRQDPDGYARTCEALALAQAVDPERIACPTLLVTGDEDVIAPPQAVRFIGERIARSGINVQTEVLRGCGHWTPIEMPEASTALLRRFYAQRFEP